MKKFTIYIFVLFLFFNTGLINNSISSVTAAVSNSFVNTVGFDTEIVQAIGGGTTGGMGTGPGGGGDYDSTGGPASVINNYHQIDSNYLHNIGKKDLTENLFVLFMLVFFIFLCSRRNSFQKKDIVFNLLLISLLMSMLLMNILFVVKNDIDTTILFENFLMFITDIIVIIMYKLLDFIINFKLDPNFILDIIEFIVWPITILICALFFRKVFTYLFLSMEEFNFFGSKGKFRPIQEVINERAKKIVELEKSSQKFIEKEKGVRSDSISNKENAMENAIALIDELRKENSSLRRDNIMNFSVSNKIHKEEIKNNFELNYKIFKGINAILKQIKGVSKKGKNDLKNKTTDKEYNKKKIK